MYRINIIKYVQWCYEYRKRIFHFLFKVVIYRYSNSVKYIGDSSFEGCTSVISISIGNGIQQIGSQAFSNCSDLENFTCHSIVVPQTDISAFDNSYTEYAKLKVPDESLNAYKATAPWSGFGSFEGFSGNVSEKEKCATPTKHYANGKITFECETEGVTYQSTITNPDVASYYGNEINLGGTYNVKVEPLNQGGMILTKQQLPSTC